MTITAKEAAKQRREIRRDLERDLKQKDREKLRRLRAHMKHARTYRKDRMRSIVKLCRDARRMNRESAKLIRAAHRRQAQAEVDAQRVTARTACEANKERVREKARGSLERASAALTEERRHQQTMRLYEKPAQIGPKAPRSRRGRAAELREESEHEVEVNLPAELLPVWRRMKSQIKASPRRTRTEAFLEWVEENRGDVQHILDEQIERDVARLVAAEGELRRAMRSPRRYRGLDVEQLERAHRAYDMPASAVPF